MVPPLTTQRLDGRLYTRKGAVEAAIAAALAMDEETVLRWARLRSGDPKQLMQNECLLHLVRHAFREGNQAVGSRLLQILLERCKALVKQMLPVFGWLDSEQFLDEALGRFSMRVAEDGIGAESLDYFEVNFRGGLRVLMIDLARAETRAMRSLRMPRPTAEDEAEELTREEMLGRLRAPGTFTPPNQEQRLVFLEAMNSLPEHEREAVVLVHIMGYDIEADDPEKPTAASLCRVTGRAIRHRLSRAEEKLARFFEEE
jgi:hypothetical protein